MSAPFASDSRVEIRWMSAPPSGVIKVNGLPVHPRGVESRWEAALRQAARIASRQGGVAEAVIITPGEPDRHVRVDERGDVEDLVSSEGVSDADVPVTEEFEEPAVYSSGWRPQVSEPTGATRRTRRAQREPVKVRVPWPGVGVAAAGLALLAAGAGVYSFLKEDSGQGDQIAVAPLGFTSAAAWSVGSVATSVNVVPVPGGIAYVGEDRSLRVVEAKSGAVRWEGRIPVGEVKTGPTVMLVDHQACLVGLVDEQLLWWSLDTGESHAVEVPAGATLSPRGVGPVVELGPGAVGTIKGGALTRVALPRGSTAVNARADGAIVAVSAAGWHVLRDGAPAGKPTPFEAPAPGTGGSPSIVGFLPAGGGQLVTVWPPAQGAQGRYRVAVYADSGSGLRLAFSASLTATDPTKPLTLNWRPSPSGDWGVLGRYLVDVREGVVRDLGAVNVATVAGDRARGVIDGQIVVVGPSMPTGVMIPNEPLPEAVTSDGAYVLDRQTRRLSLLPPTA